MMTLCNTGAWWVPTFAKLDPLGHPTVPAYSDHCFHTCFRPYVRNIVKLTSLENNDRYWSGLGVWPRGSSMTHV